MQIFVMPAWIGGIRIRKDDSQRHPCQPGFQHSLLEWRDQEVVL